MSIEQIKRILYDKMGLDANSIGDSALHNALNKRQTSRALKDITEYTSILASSIDELHSFIEEIVVPETWFFRDHEPFKALKNIVLEWHHKHINHPEPISILSLPSSTGEEPYSIAMTMLEAGISPDYFSIDAIDISQNAIQKARFGQYGKNSFRALENKSVLDKYFNCVSDRIHAVKDEVKACVNFIQGNIFELQKSPIKTRYDVIFCRNMLIYFDLEKKKFAFKQLSDLLRKDGILFLGHSECGIVNTSEFHPIPHSRSFAFIKSPAIRKSPAAAKPVAKTIKLPKKTSTVNQPDTAIQKTNNTRPASTAQKKKEGQKDILTQARQLADQGNLEEANQQCQGYIKENIYNPDGYVLMSLIMAAGGDDAEAENMLRKAIYLNPRHHEALIHLSLLLERQGDVIGADLLKKRISRLSS